MGREGERRGGGEEGKGEGGGREGGGKAVGGVSSKFLPTALLTFPLSVRCTNSRIFAVHAGHGQNWRGGGGGEGVHILIHKYCQPVF